MTKAAVYNQTGEKTAEVDLPSGIFDVKANSALLEQAVRTYLSNARSSIAATKTRDEVRGGGRKPWKQKGTGRARHGSIRSPLWKGGGVTFGPTPDRNWSLKMNKRAYRKALFMALSDKISGGGLAVVEGITLGEVKSKSLNNILKDLAKKTALDDRNLLLVLPRAGTDLKTAGRNIRNLKIMDANTLNVFDVLNASGIILFKDAISAIEQNYREVK